MARTGPQKIPGASQQHFFGTGRYSGSDMEVNCGVAHTTEGMTLPTYSGGAEAPNVTGVPDFAAKKIRWYQHFDVDESARALMNRAGGVETNTANVFQIELVGTCDANHAKAWGGKKAGVDYIYWPDAPDWALAEVAWLVRWLHDRHDVPLTCVKDWLAYGSDSRRPGVTPASYGASPARMSMAAWRNFTGWCGHQHVPENDHGDPGSMDFARVIALAKGTTTPEEDDPMAGITKKDIFDAVWKTDSIGAPSDAADFKTNPTWQAQSILKDVQARVRRMDKTIAAQSAAITALAGQVGKGADTATVVAAVQKAIADAVIKVDVDINSKEG
ncbi:hypothetical protein ACFU98_35430 [Streptomyces sp. NPDC057575]|uniref:hypothetical protein n=1 Tax=unclassified Streptomyces TaxID=2593676 RepID=UPI00368BE865